MLYFEILSGVALGVGLLAGNLLGVGHGMGAATKAAQGARLSEVPNIRYIKDASTNTGRLLSILNETEGRMGVFAASAHIPVCVMLIGGAGWMAGPACVIPRQSVQLYELARQGAWTEAMALQRRLWAMNQAFAKYSLAACIKGGLELQGFPVGPPLPPQAPLSEAGREDVGRILESIGALAPEQTDR